MSFYLPTRVLFGKDAVLSSRELLQSMGESYLVITGKSSRKNGSLDDLLDALEGKRVEVFDGTPENPSVEFVESFAKEYLGEGSFDVVVGLGGGSPMDAAKAIAVLLENPELTGLDLYDTTKYGKAKPVVCVPTTAGTGSEVTQYSVLTLNNWKKGFSHECVFPKVALVDYKYTLSMDEELTLSTALDALSHAVEGYISLRSTPFAEVLALEAVRLIKEYLPKVLDDPENEYYRERISFASTLAGMVIAQTGTTVGHALGYSLTVEKGVKHGLATGVFLPFELDVAREVMGEKVDAILRIFGGSLRSFYRDLGVRMQITITDEEIERWSKMVLGASHLKSTPGTYSEEGLKIAYEEVRSEYVY